MSHHEPDPDSLGTALALAAALEQFDATAIVGIDNPSGVTPPLTDLPGVDRVVQLDRELLSPGGAAADADLAIAVDTATPDLLGVDASVVALLNANRTLVNIDHHVSNTRFGDVNLVDVRAAATAEVVWSLLVSADIPIAPEIATNLQAGLVADTLGFQTSEVRPRTLRAAADLVARGGGTDGVPRHVLNARTLAGTRLFGAALAAIETDLDDRLVWTSVTRDLAEGVGATVADTQGVPNGLQFVTEVVISVVFYEVAPDRTRVSLRSLGPSIREVAEEFGGGGHERAAGATLFEPIAAARERVLARLRPLLES